jgi:hypothetical protein
MQNSIIQSLATRILDRLLTPRELLSARKIVYIGLILLLFTGTFLWRRYWVEPQAHRLAILEESQGDIELSSRLLQLTLTGSRGVATCVLWASAIDKQKKNQWNELEFVVRSLTKLQPHFLVAWEFQSWNLAYNVPALLDRVPDKYFYVSRGVEVLYEGERQNQNTPDLRFTIGYTMQHKISQSDQRNTMRSLFDLSLIPPSERDPARFLKEDEVDGINWPEFEKFCKKYPQLVRRLHDGIRMETKDQQEKLFVCKDAKAVIDFLSENKEVPSIWTRVNGEDRLKKDLSDRYPLLPPYRESVPAPQHLFKPHEGFVELTDRSALDNSVDVFAVARAWYSYAQEPIPDPSDRPGKTKDIVNPVTQKMPKHMATIIFRGYPAVGEGQIAERLQGEGWYDDEPWRIRNWFRRFGGNFSDRKTPARVGPPPGANLSQDAWKECAYMWDKHGEDNHLIVPPDVLANHEGDTEWMRNYQSGRTIGNFIGHHMKSHVERETATVQARKRFYTGWSHYLNAEPSQALAEFERPEGIKGWIGVLMNNKDFRNDYATQESTFEIQLNYMLAYKLVHAAELKEMREGLSLAVALHGQAGLQTMVGLGAAVAPMPAVWQKANLGNRWTEPIPQLLAFVRGPFDVMIKNEEGKEVPLIDPKIERMVLERKQLIRAAAAQGAKTPEESEPKKPERGPTP